ncbi:lipoate--protein ligase family protein [Chlamydia sp. 17-3921]|uniref:lipoyl protein ligase domain-containing protein n=1 Tax=Chlamydia sp. 17-3921 TaxID=2675798 RepID=UPI0019180A45|nr:lipoate--protein ligase family protein [Chlamydia sp. 17-3921]
MKIRIVDSGKGSAGAHMAKDERLLNELKDGELILHLYEWESSLPLTYGHFMQPKKFLVEDFLSLGLDASKRPTGGGFIFHNRDYAFSLLMSSSFPGFSHNVLENYLRVNSLVLKVLHKVFHISGSLAEQEESCSQKKSGNFCMAKTSKYDVLLGFRKVGGAAQRKVQQGFLHQGSLFLSGNSREFYKRFLLSEVFQEVTDEIERHAFFPLGIEASSQDLSAARKDIKESFIQIICNENI